MVTKGLIVRLEAKASREEDLVAFLQGAVPLVEAEQQTIAWLAVQIGASSFAIVDVFADDAGRKAHLAGPVAAALLERGGELLSAEPDIQHVDVLAAKLPAAGRADQEDA